MPTSSPLSRGIYGYSLPEFLLFASCILGKKHYHLFMKVKVIWILFLIFGISLQSGTSYATESINVIAPYKSSTQESNFYSLNLDFYSIPEAKSLITAVSGQRVFIGERSSRVIRVAEISSNGIKLLGLLKVPSSLVPDHKSNALLDMVTTDKFLFLAVVDGADKYPLCGGVRIYQYALSNLDLTPKEIFKSSPCVQGELFWDARLAVKDNQLFVAGGNSLVKYDDGTFPSPDSLNFVAGMKFPKTNFYGAVSSIDLSTKKTTLFAKGLRHLGGLVWDKERKVLWESENGPRGGDELNIILRGKDYGWPVVTLGRPYDSELAPEGGVRTNSLGNFEAPIYSWTPSISPSTIRKIPVKGEFSKYWGSDLIVGSLKGNQLRRLRITAENSVLYDEPIPIGERIRTLDFLSDGKLILGTDLGHIVVVSDGKNSLTGRYPKDPPAAG